MQEPAPHPAAGVTPLEPSAETLSSNVRLLGVASLVNDIAGEMIFPLVPTFLLTQVGGGTASLGAVEGVADTVASVVKLWSGGLSDRAGKRKIFVVLGYALAAVSRPLVALAGAPWHVLVVRSSDRFGKGIRAAPRDAMIAESTAPAARGRAFGYTRAMDHLGAAIGPLLAFSFLWMWPDNLRVLFALTAIPGLVVVLAVWLGLREQPLVTHAAKEVPSTIAPLDRNFRIYLVALVVFALGNSSDSFLLVRVHELGVATEMLPLIWCAFHIIKSAGSLLAGRAIDRIGARPLIYLGWIVYALVYLAFAQASTALEGWAFFMVYGVFYALTEPAERTFVLTLVGERGKGLAYGWFNLAIGIAALPANLAFGLIYQGYGGAMAFGWSAALAVAAVALLSVVRPSATHLHSAP